MATSQRDRSRRALRPAWPEGLSEIVAEVVWHLGGEKVLGRQFVLGDDLTARAAPRGKSATPAAEAPEGGDALQSASPPDAPPSPSPYPPNNPLVPYPGTPPLTPPEFPASRYARREFPLRENSQKETSQGSFFQEENQVQQDPGPGNQGGSKPGARARARGEFDEKSQKKEREWRDLAWETMERLAGYSPGTSSERGKWNAALAQIRRGYPGSEAGGPEEQALCDEITRRWRMADESWDGGAGVTPTALARNWGLLGNMKPRRGPEPKGAAALRAYHEGDGA